ncbi:hypothetical protein BJY00DRAFT_318470 [Aspergillus carlsbadensis]|nr:hypothetical protein BJY00DRAFT_318470 [Aspergillus carlsbadensis]
MDLHLPSEIWLQIGNQITQRRQHTLRSLTETCRSFHAIFTPLFLASLRFTKFQRICAPEFVRSAPIRNLRHVRRLKIIAGCGYAEGFEADEEAALYARFHRNLIRCLENMPNLVSFTFGLSGPWKTGKEEGDGVPYVPLFSSLLRALQSSCPKLQTLDICVGDFPTLDGTKWLIHASHSDMHRLVPFGGVRSLALAGGFILPDSTDAIVSTLLASPRLVDLSLENYSLPLISVCTQYAKSGGTPLGLERLRYRIPITCDQDAWPYLHRLTDVGKLECLELEIGQDGYRTESSFGRRIAVCQTLTDPSQFRSLRRLTIDRLDNAVFTAIQTVGQSLDFPPFFLSELFAESFDSRGCVKDGFNFHPEKQKYWPTCFVLGDAVPRLDTADFNHRLMDEISNWEALRLLHLGLDLTTDKTLLINVIDSLNTNLRELYITNEDTPQGRDPFGGDSEYGELDYAARLCANSRIAYLVVNNFYFRVVREVGRDARVEYVDLYSSEAEEAEIFMMYRERMEI